MANETVSSPHTRSTRSRWRLYTALLWRWFDTSGISTKLAIFLVIAAFISGIATYILLSRPQSFTNDTQILYWVLNLDLVILLLLSAMIGRRVAKIWAKRRQGLAGAKLHIRLIALMSFVATFPAIVVAVFSAIFFYTALQGWFSDRIRVAVSESLSVAQAYLSEHQETLRGDILSMGNDLNREAPRLLRSQEFFNQFLSTQAILRGLTEAIVFEGNGQQIARSNMTFSLQFAEIPESSLSRARQGEVVLMTSDMDDRVRALIQLDNFVDSYLLVGRLIAPQVINYMRSVEQAVADYNLLEGSQGRLQISFTLIYLMVTFLLLLIAIWLGVNFAQDIVTPIGRLIAAAEQVRAGDLSARVRFGRKEAELDSLGRAFNRMTEQLEKQQRELVEANQQIDSRRRFTETVLSGVSSAVLGIDPEKNIHLPNRTASEFFQKEPEELINKPIDTVFPELLPMLQEMDAQGIHFIEGQIETQRQEKVFTLFVRVIWEEKNPGYVVTFYDITELISAQRNAAWADVARRIAHEIKNPLTPIQLAAERLRKKYSEQIADNRESFEVCITTIIRQVQEMQRMVDEFSKFARLPAAHKQSHDIAAICQQALAFHRSAFPRIAFSYDSETEEVSVVCDSGQITQMLNNILQNAIDAIEGEQQEQENADGSSNDEQGQISLYIHTLPENIRIHIRNTGLPIPENMKGRVTEPYVTTKQKGTGLGLAIVKKIIEDHQGDFSIANHPEGGVEAVITLPR